jgi:hypothetical protein
MVILESLLYIMLFPRKPKHYVLMKKHGIVPLHMIDKKGYYDEAQKLINEPQ